MILIYRVTESELSLLFWQGLLFTKQIYLAILELECSEKQLSISYIKGRLDSV